jgi:Tfp pilus assembly protein PilX
MSAFKKVQQQQRGTILLVFLITLPFLILTALYAMNLALTSYPVGRFDQVHTAAQLAADAGADYAIEQISQNNDWTGTASEITLHNDSSMRTTYAVNVTGDDNSKVVAVTGRTYWPATATTANRSVSIYVDMRPVTSGNFSVISGAGGLFMSNSSKVVGGDVFINGEINMSNSAQIGLSTKPVNVKVAHQICPTPADATYPRVCASGENGQPISISNTAHIYGEVRATNQTNGSGMSSPGLVSGSTVAPQALPTYDRAAQKAAITQTITGAAASCSGSGSTRTWLANTKIIGNVTISNKCKVTVLGNVWITGSLNLSNNGTEIIVADSLGSTRPNIMVDAAGGISISTSAAIRANTTGTGFGFYTFYSTASCTPDCTNVTGTDLATSRSVTTINIDTSGDAANSIFYAYWSQVQLANSGQIGALIGQTIRLSNSGTVTFGSSVSTGEVTWVSKGYRRQ